MEQKQIAALEISNRTYKLVIGYVLDNKVDILLKIKKPLSVPFKDGDIFDIGSLSDDLSKIQVCESNIKNAKLKFNVNEVSLVLPSYGLQVYRSIKSTNTISNVSKIDKIDISNALALVRKEKLPSPNDVLVDIIPTLFGVDDGKSYTIPPLGKTSSNVTIDANVYTLPKKMIGDMKKACENAGIKVGREVISSIGVISYLKNIDFQHQTYVLVDFGEKTTTLSFVGKNTLYSSNFFSLGIEDLVEQISLKLNVTREQAADFKNLFGLDMRKTVYNPVLAKNIDEAGNERKYTKDDILQISFDFLKNWLDYFTGSLNNLLSNQNINSDELNIPLVFIGSGSKLNGLKEYMLKMLPSSQITFVNLDTVGANESEFINCIGAIYVSSQYRGTFEDENKNFINTVTREKEKTRDFYSKKDKYDETRDDL